MISDSMTHLHFVPRSDIPEQAEVLAERIRLMGEAGQINLSQDWKVITLFIGGNDLCDVCKSTVRTIGYTMCQAYEYIWHNYSRTIWNVVIYPCRPSDGAIHITILNSHPCHCLKLPKLSKPFMICDLFNIYLYVYIYVHIISK